MHLSPALSTTISPKKLGLISSLALVPLLFHLSKNYILTGRGYHDYQIQYITIAWAVRLLLLPLLILCLAKFVSSVRNVSSFVILLLSSAGAFMIAHVMFTFILSMQTASPDKRLWNLFNTIRHESISLNLIIFAAAVLIFYLWTFIEESSSARKQNEILLRKIENHDLPADSLTIKTGQRSFVVKFADIICVQADGHYIKVTTPGRVDLLSMTIKDIQKTLPSFFVRVHRSSIINSRFVLKTRSLMNGDYVAVMQNGDEIRVSRTYRENLRSLIGKF
jgi:hypothetical protein